MSDDWLALLRNRVSEIGIGATARELGVSRTSVSMLVSGRYPGNTEHMAARIIGRYTRNACPHDGASVSPADCARYAEKVPTSSPAALRRWRACQTCEFNPKKGD